MTQDLGTLVLLIVFLICGLGLILVVIWLIRANSKNRVRGRVDSFVGVAEEVGGSLPVPIEGPTQRVDRFEGFRGKLNRALAVFSTEELQLKISSAYWPITDVEFIVIRIVGVVLGLIIGTLIPRNIIGGLGLALLFYIIPGIVLDQSIQNRRKKFQFQLLDVLVLVKGAVQAGYSLPQALDLAVGEVPAPASEEFGRVLREVRFGFPLEQALVNLGSRIQSDDLQLVVTAIVINSQVGGNLSTVLEAAIDTIRDRIHLFGEVRSLTSYARWVGNFISLLPFIAGLIIFLLSPDYFKNVKDSMITQIIFGLALLGVILGNILIRRIVKIRV